MLLVIAIFAIIVLSNAQNCLKSNGEPVAWWVIMKIPPKIGNIGFGYYDSTMKTSKFAYYDVMVDVGSTPLTKTEEQINSQNLQYVAWNDEKPNGQTSESVAHSKGLMAYSISKSQGFFITHSIPKYPAFFNGKIDPTLGPAENIYGQHLACFSLTVKELNDLAFNLLIM